MQLNFSQIFPLAPSPPPLPNPIISNPHLQFSLPHPHNFKAQISIKNYRSQIDFICRRKNIPFEVQRELIGKFQSSIERMSRPIEPQMEMEEMEVTRRMEERERKRILQLEDAKFKKAVKEVRENREGKIGRMPNKPVKQQQNTSPIVHEKLHQQTICRKPLCNRYLNRQQRDKLQEFRSVQELRTKPKINPISDYIESNKPERKNEQIHEKLHKNSYVRDHKINKMHEDKINYLKFLSDKLKVTNNSRKLLKSSKSFIERVEEEIKNREKRNQFLSIKQIDFATNKQLFRPQINYSTVNPKVYQFRNKSVEEDHHRTISKSPKVELLNRSVEIIQAKETRYINNLANKLFSDGKLSLDVDSVSKLGDQEFTIIYPFLSTLERETRIRQSEFEERFGKFYHTLSISDKQTLKKTIEDRTSKSRSFLNKQQNYFKVKNDQQQPKLNPQSLKIATSDLYQRSLEFV